MPADSHHDRGRHLQAWEDAQGRGAMARLSAFAGINPSYYRRFKMGAGPLSLRVAVKTSDYTGIPIGLLLDEEDIQILDKACDLRAREIRQAKRRAQAKRKGVE